MVIFHGKMLVHQRVGPFLSAHVFCHDLLIQSWDVFRMSTALLLFAMLVKTCSGHTQFVVLIVLQQMQTLGIPGKYLSQVLFETTCSDNSYSISFILFPGIYIVSLQMAVSYAWLKSLGWSLEFKSSNLFRDFSQVIFDVWPMDFIQSTASNNEKMLDARPRDFISMIYLCLFVRPWILSLAPLA